MRTVILWFLLPSLGFAAPATFRVLDGTGAPLKDVLVIVKSLDSPFDDLPRQLTDEQGRVRTLELKAGLYRVIATDPYGIWETAIKEFLVADQPVDLSLAVAPQPSHGYGDIVSLPVIKANLKVLMPDGGPAAGAEVLVRDLEDTLYRERRYRLDKDGESKIELVASPTVLVVIYNGKVFTTRLAQTDTDPVVRFSPD